MPKRIEIEAVLSALNPELEKQGFRLAKKKQEWSRSDVDNRDYIHLNFGLSLINPSVGVDYLDIARSLPKEVQPFSNSCAMLKTLVSSSREYLLGTSANHLARDIIGVGIPFLGKLHNRSFVIDLLSSQKPADWPAFSYSHRIRLLPILLAAEGRLVEAKIAIDKFAADQGHKDQANPNYKTFSEWFRGAYSP